jgi:hypothetical protein
VAEAGGHAGAPHRPRGRRGRRRLRRPVGGGRPGQGRRRGRSGGANRRGHRRGGTRSGASSPRDTMQTCRPNPSNRPPGCAS